MVADASLTRYEVSLGARDDTTGWRAETTSSNVIEGSIQPRGSSKFFTVTGKLAPYVNTLYTPDVVHEGDIIQDAFNQYYRLTTVEDYSHLNQFSHYQCEADKLANYPETTGTTETPNLDDPRHRTRVWLGYVNLASDWGSMYAYPHYPLQMEFTGDNDEDVIFLVDHPDVTPLQTYNHYIYAYVERVPITICVLQKFSQTVTQELLWAAEDSLRTACRDYPLGSVRTIEAVRDKTLRAGSATLAMRECILKYKRASEYAPTYPRITWGPSASPTGTYYFPNVVDIQDSGMSPDARTHPPGWVGNIKQPLGAGPYRFKLICDLDVDNATYTWKRPQTSTPKTDVLPHQVIMDIDHNGGIDEPYQTLTISANGPAIKVRYVNHRKYTANDGSEMLEVEFEEYTATNQSGNSLATRMGFS